MSRSKLIAVPLAVLALSLTVAAGTAAASPDWKQDKDRYHSEPRCFQAIDRVAKLTVAVNAATDAAAKLTADLAAAEAVLVAVPLPVGDALLAAQKLVAKLTADLAVAGRTLADLRAQLVIEVGVRDRVCRLADGTPTSSTSSSPTAPASFSVEPTVRPISNIPVGAVDTGSA